MILIKRIRLPVSSLIRKLHRLRFKQVIVIMAILLSLITFKNIPQRIVHTKYEQINLQISSLKTTIQGTHIPKIIHTVQNPNYFVEIRDMYFGTQGMSGDGSIIENNQYSVITWTPSLIQLLVAEHYPKAVLRDFNAFKNQDAKTDIASFFILDVYGGVYTEADNLIDLDKWFNLKIHKSHNKKIAIRENGVGFFVGLDNGLKEKVGWNKQYQVNKYLKYSNSFFL